MYELTGIFRIDEKYELNLPSRRLLANNFSYEISDHKLEIDTPYLAAKGYSREPLKNVYVKIGASYHFLLGEAYSSREYTGKRKSTFFNVTDIVELAKSNKDYLNILKGNFIYIVFDAKNPGIEIISSRLSLLALYLKVDPHRLIISTNLADLCMNMEEDYRPDYSSIIAQQLFYFPFGTKTIIKNVMRIPSASILRCSAAKSITVHRYFDYRNYYSMEKFKEKPARELFADKFYQVIDDLTGDRKAFNVALTGGFDSRTILGVLKGKPVDIQAYSFGIQDSLNVNIPLEMSRKLNFNYFPIWLGDEFKKDFGKWYELTTLLSDGYLGLKANYPYAYDRLKDFSKITLNGNWGSEAIRPFQNFGDIIAKDFFDIGMAKDKIKKFKEIYENYSPHAYLNQKITAESREEIIADLEKWFNDVKDFPPIKQIHMYLYFENERKFFANEIQTERKYVTNRYPYYDDDIIYLLFKCPFSGINKRPFKKSYYSIYKSQYIYYYILNKYSPDLLPFITDHGFSPRAFGNWAGLFEITFGYLKKVLRRRFSEYREFDNHQLSCLFYNNNLENYINEKKSKEFISPNFYQEFKDNTWRNNSWRFHNFASFLIWMNDAPNKICTG